MAEHEDQGDLLARQARENHRRASSSEGRAAEYRKMRNDMIRQLRQQDPERWTYPVIAEAVGCSPELVAAIIQGRTK